MELRTLRYFVAIADNGSVSAAADVVHVTQPALSRQLRHLERDLGVELFFRHKGRLVLSAAGKQFLPIARDLLVRSDNARSAAAALATGKLDRITIAAPTTTVTDVIAPFFATLSDDDPLPTVLESDSSQAYEALQHGADLAIATEEPRPPLESTALAVLPMWAYVRADHRWSDRHAVRLEELARERIIVLPPKLKPRKILDGACDQAGISLADVVESSNAQVAQALAAAGRGIAVVTDDPRFGLIPVEIHGDSGPLSIRLFAAWDPHHHARAALAELSARLRSFCINRYGPAVAPGEDGS